MLCKIKRNTVPATMEAARRKRSRQELVREMIRVGIFLERCVCGRCKNGDYSNLCTSYGNIAKLANQKELLTTTGKKGKWQATQVSRLFPESGHKDQSSKTVVETKQKGEFAKLF